MCFEQYPQLTNIQCTMFIFLLGLFGVLGLVLYPWGWGADRVKRLCGENSEPYIPGDCSIGQYETLVGNEMPN